MPIRKPLNLRKPPTVSKRPVKYSKRVLRRIKAAASLHGAIVTFKAHAATGFRNKLAAELRDGETMPDQILALELVDRSVQTAIGQLRRAEETYRQQATERWILNEACTLVAREETYPELVDVRRSIERRFGREAGCFFHGMEGNTRRKPGRQHPQLEHLVAALERGPMPKPLRPGPPGERRGWLQQLKPGYRKLTAMLDDLREHDLREALLRDDRDFELESFDVVHAEAPSTAGRRRRQGR